MDNCLEINSEVITSREDSLPRAKSTFTCLSFFSLYFLFSIILQIVWLYLSGADTSALQDLPSQLQMNVVFGIVVGFCVLLVYSFAPRTRAFFAKSRDFISWLLSNLALIVIISTFIKGSSGDPWFRFWSDLTHSFPFTGLIGILTATLAIGIWQLRCHLKSPTGFALGIVHFGALIFLIGTGVTSAFGIQGILNMHEGETASSFLPLIHGKPSAEPLGLPASIKLIDFTTEYYPEEAQLRVYRHNKGEYNHVQTLSKDKKVFYSIGASRVEVANFYPEFSVDYKITEQPVGTSDSVSAGLVTIRKAHEQESGWIFADDHEDGYLQGNGALVLLTRSPLKEAKASLFDFQKKRATSLPSQVLLIPARGKSCVLLTHGKEVQTFLLKKLPLNISLDNLDITLDRLHPDSLVETTYQSISDSLKNPVVEVNVAMGNQRTIPYLLTANKPEPVALGDGTFLLLEKTTPQPKFFKSLVQVMPNHETAKPMTHEIAVNQPLSLGNIKIYQADFRREDPTFSGFSVTSDPGRGIVIFGFALIVLGLLIYFLIINSPRGKMI